MRKSVTFEDKELSAVFIALTYQIRQLRGEVKYLESSKDDLSLRALSHARDYLSRMESALSALERGEYVSA